MKHLKIAIIAPFEESVPPKKYGGTEFVVHTLVEELHRQGHAVTLFASGDSKVSCKLVPIVPKAIGSGKSKRLREALTYQGLIKVARYLKKERFDVIHNHLTNGWQTLLFKDEFHAPVLTTTHFMLHSECESTMYSQFKDMPYASISDSQREPLPDLNYIATVYHGLNLTPFRYNPAPGSYLAFLGRFSPDKGPVDAINIARMSGRRLIMAAKINSFERTYYEKSIKPLIDGNQITFIGEVDLPGKVELLRNAAALLNPVHLHESFGLTNIEAMAVGTPVVALKNGALPEIIRHEKTGFLCTSTEEMVDAISRLDSINRADCRRDVEERFTAKVMADNYVSLYTQLAEEYGKARNALRFTSLQRKDFPKARVPAWTFHST